MINHISICFLSKNVLFVNKSTHHDKPHFDLFFTTERELKKAFRDTLTQAAWYGLLSKMAN